MAQMKMEDVFSFSALDPAKMTESFRDFAEKSARQSREAYAKMKSAGEEATRTLEATVESAQSGSVEIGRTAIGALRASAENSLSYVEALLGAKTVSEAIELQTRYLSKQMDLTLEQARSLQETSRRVAETVAKPGKEAAEKAMSAFKAA